MAIAKEDNNQSSHTVAVIGDGAMTAGMAFEALNHAVHCKQRLLIILNDNTMSISENVGGLAKHLESIWQKKTGTRQDAPSVNTANLFEDIGIDYTGPIDGHDIKTVSHSMPLRLRQAWHVKIKNLWSQYIQRFCSVLTIKLFTTLPFKI